MASTLNLLYYFFLQLEYDILEYVVIERLAQSGREKLKEDGLNLSDWLQSLASFWGHLYVCSLPITFAIYGLFFVINIFDNFTQICEVILLRIMMIS